MQKYLLYRKGLQIADIDRNDVKHGAQRAFSEWLAREHLLFDEKMEEREAFTFRFAEMRGYREGYEGSCYWVSFSARRPYLKKDGHHLRQSHFDLWIYWDQNRWNVLPFSKPTLDDDFLILLQSWKQEEKPDLLPPLKEKTTYGDTTTDDIYVDILQRLQRAHVRLGATLTYEEAEHIEEDEDGNEIYIPAGDVQVWFMVEDEMKLYEGNRIILPRSAFNIDDLEEVGFEVEEHHPSPLDTSLSFEERIEQTTDLETLCSLINELADMGCEVTMKVEEKDGAPLVRVLDVEYINNNDGLDGLSKLLSRGKYEIYYLPFPEEEAEERSLNPDVVKRTELPTYMSFWVWYNQEAASYRIDHGDEDALTYYHTNFLPKIRTARANREIPSLLF